MPIKYDCPNFRNPIGFASFFLKVFEQIVYVKVVNLRLGHPIIDSLFLWFEVVVVLAFGYSQACSPDVCLRIFLGGCGI